MSTLYETLVLDPRLQQILREIQRLTFGDPTAAAGKAGNFDARLVPIATPTVANQELVVVHGLGRVPVGFVKLIPALAGYGDAELNSSQDADSVRLFLKSPDTGRKLTLMVL